MSLLRRGGLWPLAGRLAGWPDSRPWWTGSCPCQGESLSGKRLGADDPRHLWPDLHRLIRAARPPVIMGEQVAAAAGTHWLDGVCADLEAEDYAARAVDIPACAVDAPHQRNRLYWTAVDNRISAGLEGLGRDVAAAAQGWSLAGRPAAEADAELQPITDSGREARRFLCGPGQGRSANEQRPHDQSGGSDGGGGVQSDADVAFVQGQSPAGQQPLAQFDAGAFRNGSWWADAEWIISPLDGKARRTKPGLPFLVDGLPGRVDLWRIGGNAISPILAAEVIAAFLESEDDFARDG